jgi:hypothetical protein
MPAGILQRRTCPSDCRYITTCLPQIVRGNSALLEIDIPGGGVPGVEREEDGMGCTPHLVRVQYAIQK